MIAAGVNAKALATFMGHANIGITLDLYGHVFPGAEDEAAGLLDAYLSHLLRRLENPCSEAPSVRGTTCESSGIRASEHRLVRDSARPGVFSVAMKVLVATVAGLGAALAIAAPVAMAAGEPVVSTGNATAITSTSATLNGTVNPEGQTTTYYFEYGTTTSYGSQTPSAAAGSGTAGAKVSAPVAPLVPNETYHYRLVATDPSGTTLGSDVSFKTPKPPLPAVTTGGPKALSQTSATLTGTVDPEGAATSYVFQYGTSTSYGSDTAAATAGSGTKNVAVSAAIGTLAPNTTYHYRLAATNVNGTTYGHDVSFKTAKPPAGVTIAALSSTITFGQLTSVSGRVLPPRPSALAVTLQSSPGPGGPWTDVATANVASSGAYTFARLAPSDNTYYRVVGDGATSAGVLVTVRFRVGLRVSRLHPPAGSLVRFHGLVGPHHNGLRVLVQRLGPRGHWHTVRQTRLGGAGGGLSSYSVRVRIERNGRYRVAVGPDAAHARGVSRTVRVRVR